MNKAEITKSNILIEGNFSRLFVEKTDFTENEPVNIKAVGKGNDWVGIFLPKEESSVRWYYIDNEAHGDKAPGSGNVQDMRKSAWSNEEYFPSFKDLPCGDYIIRLIPDGAHYAGNDIAKVKIKILPDPSNLPKAPISVQYDLLNTSEGFAEGDVIVEVCKDRQENLDIRMFWADEKGKLCGYAPLAKFKVTGDKTVYHLPKGMIIPEGATRLLAYTALPMSDFYSEEYAECTLIEGSAMKLPEKYKYCFNVVSDIHIQADNNHMHNKNFEIMLKDVASVSENSKGIFIVGDMTNNGKSEEYDNIFSIHKSVKGAPPLYFDIGNHDVRFGEISLNVQRFLSYAKLPDGESPKSEHYDFWLENNHFIFIGIDYRPNAELKAETLEWLDAVLSRNYKKCCPTFIFLHHSLYNTVAGSLSGQMWHGEYEGSEEPLRNILKKYPEAIMFNGHSHWTLNSASNMYPSDGELPNIFNTSSCGYLWQSYNDVKGERLLGCEGYYVYVYDNMVILKGRDFQNGEWMPSAQYCVKY